MGIGDIFIADGEITHVDGSLGHGVTVKFKDTFGKMYQILFRGLNAQINFSDWEMLTVYDLVKKSCGDCIYSFEFVDDNFEKILEIMNVDSLEIDEI